MAGRGFDACHSLRTDTAAAPAEEIKPLDEKQVKQVGHSLEPRPAGERDLRRDLSGQVHSAIRWGKPVDEIEKVGQDCRTRNQLEGREEREIAESAHLPGRERSWHRCYYEGCGRGRSFAPTYREAGVAGTIPNDSIDPLGARCSI